MGIGFPFGLGWFLGRKLLLHLTLKLVHSSVEYLSDNQNILPLKDPFYNSGEVTDSWDKVKKFIESSMNSNSPNLGGNNDEKFQYEYIKDKNDLILPLFYPDCKEEDIKSFNKKNFF